MGDALLKSSRTNESPAPARRPSAHDVPGVRARAAFPQLASGEARPSLLPAQERGWVADMQRTHGNQVTAAMIRATAAPAATAGASLPEATRARFERSLGTDLSDVRIHADAAAATTANALSARAFTLGKDIYFGAARYQPDTKEGDCLLAHEVIHTEQQGRGAVSYQAKSFVSKPEDPAEREAEALTASLVAGERVSVQARALGGPLVMRSPDLLEAGRLAATHVAAPTGMPTGGATVPPDITVPTNYRLKFKASVISGEQQYRYHGPSNQWLLDVPRATLHTQDYNLILHTGHSHWPEPPTPKWRHADDSQTTVTGKKGEIKSPGTISHLLLMCSSVGKLGSALADVELVRRVNTHGGKYRAIAGAKDRDPQPVGYTADYEFYVDPSHQKER
jgi:Domain of unknown function (DUF4157)/Protein of unknown function (DUF3455)